jgi:hypothetical protein
MMEDRMTPWKQLREAWRLQHFDEDGDGTLSDAENQARKEFDRKLADVFAKAKAWMSPDTDGDGEVSKAEKAAAALGWGVVGMRMHRRMQLLQDTDADGKVSREEALAFGETVARGFRTWTESFGKEFDTDNDSRLNEQERQAFLKGLASEIDDRLRAVDEDKNERISPFEAEKLALQLGREMEIFPGGPAPAESPPGQ